MPTRQPSDARGCLPTLFVLVFMLAIGGSGVVTALALEDRPARPLSLSDGVSLTLPTGWDFGGRLDPQLGLNSGVVLGNGVGSVVVYTSRTSAAQQVDELRADFADSPLLWVGDVAEPDVRPNQPTLRFSFAGPLVELSAQPVEGEVTAVQGGAGAVVFVAWAGTNDYRLVRDEIEAMIAEATIP